MFPVHVIDTFELNKTETVMILGKNRILQTQTNYPVRLRVLFITSLLFLLFVNNEGNSNPLRDSVKQKEKRYHVKGLARIHSQGQFWYGGRIVSPNPTFDFNFTYDRKQWGLQVFKAHDLKDPTTDINFMLAVVNKNFQLTKQLTITPSVGLLFEQAHSIADRGTDAVFIIQTSYKLNARITIDHSALLGNLLLEPEKEDWVNRLRLLYSKKHVDVTLWFWHNNSVFDDIDYVSGTLGIFYSRIKINRHWLVNLGVSGTAMPYSSNEAIDPKKNGILVTLSSLIQ
jgi:hypothetical protein